MSEKTTKYHDRLTILRAEIKKAGLDGYILPRTDEFQGEFLAPYAERLKWLTGFSGSAGAAVILDEKAVVMSDGRYTLQLKDQVDAQLYDTQDSTKASIGEWLVAHAPKGCVIGYDVWLYTSKQIEKMKEALEGHDVTLEPVEGNLVDVIWSDQPKKPSAPITLFPDDIAGRSAAQKRADIAQQLKDQNCAACLITVGDSICWLLNVRGGDIAYSPLCLSYALLYADGTLDWFIDKDKVGDAAARTLGDAVRVYGFEDMLMRLKALGEGRLWLDRAVTPAWFSRAVAQRDIDILDEDDPCIALKAIKTQSEQEAIRQAHVIDGVAVTKFLKWIDEHQNTIEISELSAEQALENYRLEHDSYLGASFSTIAGFGGNGAIIHYRATNRTNALIKGDGLLLVDSGGQYQWGTTDITRTIGIGQPSQEMKENYTRVLKGHIAVASAVFPKDTAGKDIDALARRALQEVGLDYAHGTGHGVGCYLCVHEKATHISPKEENAFRTGMVVSNEPGYYKENAYGIRVENLVLVCASDTPDHLCFETLTRAPFDTSLIMRAMLDENENAWLSSYFKSVEQDLKPHLSDAEYVWLTKRLKDYI